MPTCPPSRLVGRRMPSSAYKGRSGRAKTVQEAYRRAQDAQRIAALNVAPPQATPPPPPPPRSAVERAITAALAELEGRGPDRNAYIAPFDQAGQRAQQSYDRTIPQIASLYNELIGNIGTSQQQYGQQVAQAQANQAAQAQATQQGLTNLQAPVLADLQAQGGQAAVGSLTGGLQAHMAAGQAQVGQAAAAQQQLSQNLANAGAQSFQGRIQDARLAEQAARSHAAATLGELQGQISRQRAAAEQQYASDAASYGRQGQQLSLQRAALQDEQAQREWERQQAAADPRQQLGQLQATDNLAAYQRQRNLPPVGERFAEWGQANPVATDVLRTIFRESSDLDDAYDYLDELERKRGKDGNIKHQGKRINVNWLKDRLSELSDYWAGQ